MNEKKILKFESQYAKFSDNEKNFTQMLALLHYPHNQTNILTPFKTVPFGHLDNKKLKQNEIKSALVSLRKKALVICDYDNKYYIDYELQSHIISTHVKQNKSKEDMVDAVNRMLNPYQYRFFKKNEDDLYREFRNAFLLDFKYNEQEISSAHVQLFVIKILVDYFSPSILSKLPKQMREKIISSVIVEKVAKYYSLDSILDYLAKEFEKIGDHATLYNILLAYLLTGKVQKVENILNKNIIQGYSELALKASMYLMKGDIKAAETHFETLKQKEKGSSTKSVFCPQGIFAKYYMLTKMASNEEGSLQTVIKVANKSLRTFKNDISAHALKATALYLTGEGKKAYDIVSKKLTTCGDENEPVPTALTELEILLTFLHSTMTNYLHSTYLIDEDIERLFTDGYENGYFFNCYQALRLIEAINEKTDAWKFKIPLSKEKQAELLKKYKNRYIDYSKIVIPIPEWKATLNKLTLISSQTTKSSEEPSKQSESRLIWKVKYMEYKYSDGASFDIEPLEQLLNKNGNWTKGRKVALKRIMAMELDCMSELDNQIAKTAINMEHFYSHGYPKEEFSLNMEELLPLLTKHPYLFLEESITTPVTLIQEPPHIEITKSKKSFKLKLTPTIDEYDSYIIRKETPTRFVFTVFDDKIKKIINSLGSKATLNVPKSGAQELKTTLESLSRLVTVNSNAKELHTSTTTENTKKIKSISKIRVHLLPVADGIRAELFTRPFGTEGPYFKPGAGAANVMSEINGTPTEITRSLKKERENAEKILNACPSLANRGEINDVFYFDSSFECLELLTEINELLDEVVVEWPEGGKISIKNTFNLQSLNFNVSSGTDWFSVSGDLKINDKKVIQISELIEKSRESRFIELDKGQFIALTDSLKRQLDTLAVFSDIDGEKLNVHPLNAHQVDSIFTESGSFKKDKEWKRNIARIAKLADFNPKIPTTLSAELRQYQVDGVKWLARLAEWGVGACLADDMGLGKTVQALALVLSRATKGPTLVVSPSSVCSNWISETEKFAPTLKPILFREGDRSKILAKPQPFEIIVTSYGLLASEEAAFAKIKWSNIILDEAQYIKNHKAKRTKAALNLQGEFKLITTGTPVENHLSELWTLFSFINPRLLGTIQQFDAKFAIPIERDGITHQRQALKKIIQPFLLRRLKSEVLDELPPKTEINLTIDMSEEEKAFYEALRRESIQNVEEAKKTPGGAAHLKILAELMKLRQAACSPSLISKNLKIKSSKLEAFAEIVDELRQNRHKALVFSQFIGHLAILREYCDTNKIAYQYLDGSTPPKERSKRVDAFQNGEGDLFLISLKAGGTGLNLTAADYVIHMDPWWNPAVEDQASDRTHRIGQTRPVTVYRMIMKETVEEKIIDLHKKKRELADALLDGAEASAKMSLDDLMAVLTDTASV